VRSAVTLGAARRPFCHAEDRCCAARITQSSDLGITTKDMVDLVHERKIRDVLVDGIARIPSDVLEEFRTQRAS